ncbi:MAG: sulfurtransferase TusA family protein [Candidatus Nanopelagicales bacterium]
MSDSEINSPAAGADSGTSWPSTELWIDERGHRCPAPVIALARAARAASDEILIVVLADDPAAEFDIPAWCRMTGNELVDSHADHPGTAYLVRINVH